MSARLTPQVTTEGNGPRQNGFAFGVQEPGPAGCIDQIGSLDRPGMVTADRCNLPPATPRAGGPNRCRLQHADTGRCCRSQQQCIELPAIDEQPAPRLIGPQSIGMRPRP
jgi:hypothetical protein